jgi:hypothetical protein
LIRFLDELLEVDPYFLRRRLAVPFFKIVLVQTTSEEQSDDVVQELHRGVRIVPECHDFLTILNPTEEDLGCINGRLRASAVGIGRPYVVVICSMISMISIDGFHPVRLGLGENLNASSMVSLSTL